jgi:hypothetical protein
MGEMSKIYSFVVASTICGAFSLPHSSEIKKICRKLLEYDPEIVEIVQFGSSVYMPEHARDLDLIVITTEKKDYGGYIDSVFELNLPFDTDIVVLQSNEKLGRNLAISVRAASEILYGDGEFLKKVSTIRANPKFEWSRVALRGAKEDFKRALKKKALDRDWRIMLASNQLFDSARLASMDFLATEETRWGKVKRRLPGKLEKDFREIADTLHIRYFEGNYPKNFKKEFEHCSKKVEDFVKELESHGR